MLQEKRSPRPGIRGLGRQHRQIKLAFRLHSYDFSAMFCMELGPVYSGPSVQPGVCHLMPVTGHKATLTTGVLFPIKQSQSGS